MTAISPAPALGRMHARRLRDIHRSAGWPCRDAVEIELLHARLVERTSGALGHETLRLTPDGIAFLAQALARNRGALSAHESLVEQVARELGRAGRIVWRGLSLRARVAGDDANAPPRWCVARPDVFSIRHTSVEAYAQPVVHEIKVRRADLLGDLRQPGKRAAYLDLGGECWYVLGCDARGREIGVPDEIPAECGVMLASGGQLRVARMAPRRTVERLPFALWMALARATPCDGHEDDAQALLGEAIGLHSAPVLDSLLPKK